MKPKCPSVPGADKDGYWHRPRYDRKIIIINTIWVSFSRISKYASVHKSKRRARTLLLKPTFVKMWNEHSEGKGGKENITF